MKKSPPITSKMAALVGALVLFAAQTPLRAADVPAVASTPGNDPESVTVTGKTASDSLLDPGVVLGGGVAGMSIARDLDRLDTPYALQALAKGLTGPLGEWYEWHSVRAGGEGRFRPTREFQEGARLCRDFTSQNAEDKETVLGTACQESDGKWYVR